MKYMIGLLISLLTLLTGYSGYVTETHDAVTRVQGAASRTGQSFRIPANSSLESASAVGEALTSAAREDHANIFRTESGYSESGKPFTNQYALLTGPTEFDSNFTLSKGRFLDPARTVTPDYYVGTQNPRRVHKVGSLAVFGGKYDVGIYSFPTLFSKLDVAGEYYVELPGGVDLNTFLDHVVAALKKHGLNPPPSTQFQAQSDGLVIPQSNIAGLLTAIKIALTAVVLLLVVYKQLRDAKTVGVRRLHGHGPARVWYAVAGRVILVSAVVSIGVVLLLTCMVPGGTTTFVLQTAFNVITQNVILMVASVIAGSIVARKSLSASLKNRKDIGGIFALNVAVKTLCTGGVIVAIALVAQNIAQAHQKVGALGDWSNTAQYGTFTPTSVGNDLNSNDSSGPTQAESDKLYTLLDARGALYVDSAQFEPLPKGESNDQGSYPSAIVNVNYLARYPVMDAKGVKIHVADRQKKWVVLIPERYKRNAAQIVAYLKSTRTGGAYASKAHQGVTIVWTRDGQDFFTFDPYAGGRDNRIKDAIIQVMTPANSVPADRVNAVTGGPNGALKVKLTNANGRTTLAELQPTLRSLKLDDNLTHLVTMGNFSEDLKASLESTMYTQFFVLILLIVALMVFVAQNSSVVFDKYSRKAAVRSLFGYSLVHRYREYFRIFLAAWAVQSLGALFVTASRGDESPEGAPSAVLLALISCVFLFVVELLVSNIALAAWERRRLTRSLKEEF